MGSTLFGHVRSAAVGIVLALACVPGMTQPAAGRTAEMAAQPLNEALAALAKQTGLRLVYVSDAASGLESKAVPAGLGPQEALERLLEGTGLRFEFLNERTVRIFATGQASTASGHATGAEVGMQRLAQADGSNAPSSIEDRAQADSLAQESQTSSQEELLDEVVVTAQKRAERLKDVPISVSVLSGADLDKSTVAGITEALNRVPGVATTTTIQGGGTLVTVRGVTAGGATFTGSSPISYYLDAVPFGLVKTAIAPDANAFDLERVEVLRGPQGTLYGANAQNGVVRVLSRDANLDEFEFKARTSASSTEEGSGNYRGDVAVNLPIVPGKLAVRAVAGYQELSGWIDRPNDEDANDAEISNLRLKLNARPTEQLSIGLSAWFSRGDYGAPNYSDDEEQHSSIVDESTTTDYDVYSMKIGYEFAGFSVTSSTGYLDYANTGSVDFTPLCCALTLFSGFDADVFSQDVTFNSNPVSSWRWTVGAMYRDAEDRLRQNNLGEGPPFDYGNGSESYAAFGEIGRRFFQEKFGWALGLRYFHDDVFVRENISQGLPGEPPIDSRSTFNATTPRAVLTWYPNGDVTVYGSYSEGFRSGFSQDPGVARTYSTFPPVKPDKLHNYEIGAKADALAGRVSFETALYYIDWTDVQQSLSVPFQNTNVTALVNGASASGIGLDLGMMARPMDGLELGMSFSWNDLQFDQDVCNYVSVECSLLFARGERLNNSPEYTVGASAGYLFPLGRTGLQGGLSVSANYTSEQSIRDSALAIGNGDAILVARAGFSVSAADRWTATVFADNLNDERGAVLRTPYAFRDWDARMPPRTIGVQLEYRFGR